MIVPTDQVLGRQPAGRSGHGDDEWTGKLEAAVRALREYSPVAIYLFGSRAHGTARPDSDLDLALLFRDREAFPIEEQPAATGHLEKLVGTGVDLLVLNDARPHVRLEALETGKLLCETAGVDRLASEAMVLKECGDFKSVAGSLVDDIRDDLRRIRDTLRPTGAEPVSRPDACAAGYHYLWRATQGIVDLARAIGRHSGCLKTGSKPSYQAVFASLRAGGLVLPGLASEGQALAELRNRLVHEYLRMGEAEVHRLLQTSLPSLERVLAGLEVALDAGARHTEGRAQTRRWAQPTYTRLTRTAPVAAVTRGELFRTPRP